MPRRSSYNRNGRVLERPHPAQPGLVSIGQEGERGVMLIDAAELQKRAARNQSLFREHNECLGPASYHYSLDPPFADWACECAVESCSVAVRLTIPEYEAVRAQATHFVVAPSPDHVVADVDRVVERHKRYWIVEMTGRGAVLRKRFDPRSRKRDESRPPMREARRSTFIAVAADSLTAGGPEIVSPELVLVDPHLAIDARWLLPNPDDTLTRLEQPRQVGRAKPPLVVSNADHSSTTDEEIGDALRRRIIEFSQVEPPKQRRTRGLSLLSRWWRHGV